jgi:dethiobiotin synthetase
MLNIFVTGSNINCGKTLVSAGLAVTMQSLGYQTCVYKPIQTAAIPRSVFMQSPDLAFVSSLDPYIKTASTYLFKENATPRISAELENVEINLDVIKKDYNDLKIGHECLIADGIGGISTPLAQGKITSDLIKTLKLPIIIVTKPDLDCINSTLLSINKAFENKINVRGIIVNDYPATANNAMKSVPRLIEEYSDAKVIGILKHFRNIKDITPNILISQILNGVDVESVFDAKIAKLNF